jgi:hypothetical protein
MNIRVLLTGALLLAGCGGSGGGNGAADAPRIDAITTDAAAVQAAAPATVGKRDPGQPSGLLGYVPGSAPTRLVVFCHGLGHTVEASWYAAVEDFVDADTAVVTTNYRDNLQLPVLRAAHDTIAATLHARQRFPSIETVYLLGVSFGAAVSGTAIAEAAHVAPDGLYDYWISVEGLTNLAEAWVEATAVVPEFAGYIEEEAGGTLLMVPTEYVRRSPVMRAQEMAALGLRAAVVVHDINDGLVVYNQAPEMSAALLLAGVPVQQFNVLRVSDEQDPGTTGTGALAGVLGLDDPNNMIRLAGHGSEADYAHPVIRTGFEQLRMLLDGSYDESVPFMLHVVDDGG